MLLVSYIQQYFNTSITVLTNQVWKLLIALFKVPNTGAFMVITFSIVFFLFSAVNGGWREKVRRWHIGKIISIFIMTMMHIWPKLWNLEIKFLYRNRHKQNLHDLWMGNVSQNAFLSFPLIPAWPIKWQSGNFTFDQKRFAILYRSGSTKSSTEQFLWDDYLLCDLHKTIYINCDSMAKHVSSKLKINCNSLWRGPSRQRAHNLLQP